MRLYFLKNSELPTLEVSAMFQFGSLHEPKNKMGLITLLLAGLKTGGVKDMCGDEVDAALEQVASQIEPNVDGELSYLRMKTLVAHQKPTLDLFFGMITNPKLDAAKMQINKQRLLDQVARRNENPMGIARREFAQGLYGASSPWARVPSEASLKSITQDDIVKSYQSLIHPKHIWLAASGDIDFDDLIAQIESRTQAWNPDFHEIPKIDPVVKQWEPSLTLINKESNQSSVVMGHFGEKRFNPDKYALTLANFVLGGNTFGSRLGNHIRTSLGLAYGINSSFGLGTDFGSFNISASTKSSSTLTLVTEVKKIMTEMKVDRPISQEELDFAKQTILNQLIFEYEEPMKIAEIRRYYDYFGYPEDYLDMYQEEIFKTPLSKVNEAYNKYVFPDRLKVLIVGQKDNLGDLSPLGTVVEVPLDNE